MHAMGATFLERLPVSTLGFLCDVVWVLLYFHFRFLGFRMVLVYFVVTVVCLCVCVCVFVCGLVVCSEVLGVVATAVLALPYVVIHCILTNLAVTNNTLAFGVPHEHSARSKALKNGPH